MIPHKIVTADLVDEGTPTGRIAGGFDATLLHPDGTLLGDRSNGAFEMIPAGLAFFGFGSAKVDALRQVAQISD